MRATILMWRAIGSANSIQPILRTGLDSAVMGYSASLSQRRRSGALWANLGGLFFELRLAADLAFFSAAPMKGERLSKLGERPVAAFRSHRHQLSQVRGREMAGEKMAVAEAQRVRERESVISRLRCVFRNLVPYSRRVVATRGLRVPWNAPGRHRCGRQAS